MVHVKHDLFSNVCSKMLATLGRQIHGAERRKEASLVEMVGRGFFDDRDHIYFVVSVDVHDNSSGKFMILIDFTTDFTTDLHQRFDLCFLLVFRLPTCFICCCRFSMSVLVPIRIFKYFIFS